MPTRRATALLTIAAPGLAALLLAACSAKDMSPESPVDEGDTFTATSGPAPLGEAAFEDEAAAAQAPRADSAVTGAVHGARSGPAPVYGSTTRAPRKTARRDEARRHPSATAAGTEGPGFDDVPPSPAPMAEPMLADGLAPSRSGLASARLDPLAASVL